MSSSDFAFIKMKLHRYFKAFPYWLKEERPPAMVRAIRGGVLALVAQLAGGVRRQLRGKGPRAPRARVSLRTVPEERVHFHVGHSAPTRVEHARHARGFQRRRRRRVARIVRYANVLRTVRAGGVGQFIDHDLPDDIGPNAVQLQGFPRRVRAGASRVRVAVCGGPESGQRGRKVLGRRPPEHVQGREVLATPRPMPRVIDHELEEIPHVILVDALTVIVIDYIAVRIDIVVHPQVRQNDVPPVVIRRVDRALLAVTTAVYRRLPLIFGKSLIAMGRERGGSIHARMAEAHFIFTDDIHEAQLGRAGV
mmetsp:Transcript_7736/g.13637  ORF Transcript_7736/g.13637 Transcript_7736/m.13637 type:complete len:308 (+) Transcript_7736:958-1881(+)